MWIILALSVRGTVQFAIQTIHAVIDDINTETLGKGTGIDCVCNIDPQCKSDRINNVKILCSREYRA